MFSLPSNKLFNNASSKKSHESGSSRWERHLRRKEGRPWWCRPCVTFFAGVGKWWHFQSLLLWQTEYLVTLQCHVGTRGRLRWGCRSVPFPGRAVFRPWLARVLGTTSKPVLIFFNPQLLFLIGPYPAPVWRCPISNIGITNHATCLIMNLR